MKLDQWTGIPEANGLTARGTERIAELYNPYLKNLWVEFDWFTRGMVLNYVSRYADPTKDARAFKAQAIRGVAALGSIRRSLRHLKIVHREIVNGPLAASGNELHMHISALEAQEAEARNVYYQKRWGISRHTCWLMAARLIAMRWGALNDRDVDLRASDLADLIEVVNLVERNTSKPVSPETLIRSYNRFLTDPRNTTTIWLFKQNPIFSIPVESFEALSRTRNPLCK